MKFLAMLLVVLLVALAAGPALAESAQDRPAPTQYPLEYGPDSTVILLWLTAIVLFALGAPAGAGAAIVLK